MNKVVLGGIAAAVVIAGAGTASMVLVEQQIDNAVANAKQQIPAPFIVDVLADNSSFTQREVDLSVAMDVEGDRVAFVLENDIIKRPWGTTVHHTLKLDESFLTAIPDAMLKDFVERQFIQQDIISGTTHISPIGNYTSQLSSFSFNESVENIDMVMTAMTFTVSGNVTGDLDLSSEWAGFSMSGVDSTTNEVIDLAVKPMVITANGRYQSSSVFVGTQSMSFDGITFNSASDWESVNAEMGAMNFVSRGMINEASQYDSDFVLSVDSVRVSENGELIQVDNINLAMALNGINPSAFSDLVNEVNAMPTDGAMAPSAQLMSSANALLRDGFNFGMSDLSATLDGQSMKASFNLVFPANTVVDVNNPMSLIGVIPTVTAAANVAFDQNLAEHAQLGELIFNMQSANLLVEQGNQYVMAATFENGLALLNGERIPLPF